MKILHIVIDSKFIDEACQAFESVFPGSNTFIFISKYGSLKHVKSTPVRIVSRRVALSKKFLISLKEYDVVVLHYLDDTRLQLVERADKTIKFVWIGWGGDYYDLISKDENALLNDKTRRLKRNSWTRTPLSQLKDIIKPYVKRLLYGDINKKTIINRINYFAPVLYEDYVLVSHAVNDFKPRYLSWNYGNLEDNFLKGLEGLAVSGDNILFGNSATETNNHLDVFDKLSSVDIANRKLICPLSYGNPNYRDAVISEGVKQFGTKFVPLIELMPIHEYMKTLCTCSLAVMGHLRQQALGNIIILMHLGAKVFLDKANPVYLFFKKEGAYVYTLDEFASEYMLRLDNDMIVCNRNILQRHWGRTVIYEKTRDLITTVLS